MAHERVLITGASHGLGAALAAQLAAAGRTVMLAARNADELALRAQEIAARGGRAAICAVDLRRPEEAARLAAFAQVQLGGVDVLINNAAIGPYRPFIDNPPEELADLLALNLLAPQLLTRALLPAMLERRHGYVINIASDLARRPLANMAPYVASKHGLLGFGASLHKEVRASGVKVTTVLPGIIDSRVNGAQEGSKDRRWALPAADLAAQIATLLDLPPHVTIDELTVHPGEGDY